MDEVFNKDYPNTLLAKPQLNFEGFQKWKNEAQTS